MSRLVGCALALLAGCGAQKPAAPTAPRIPRVAAPAPIDLRVRGAAYLTQVALQLQPGWGQFLEDCRLRLPASAALNAMTLATMVELVVEPNCNVAEVNVGASGNPDFDRAVRDAIADASPFAKPPSDLLSDDQRVHLRWLFARDRRQAGPATAEVVDVRLPLAGVIDEMLARHELARAAARIQAAPATDGDRAVATEHVMIAALREALGGNETARRAAVEAIGLANVHELAPDVRAVIGVTSDVELELAAVDAAGRLGDRDAAVPVAAQLALDLHAHGKLAVADVRALVALDRTALARSTLDAVGSPPPEVALEALAAIPDDAALATLAHWLDGEGLPRASSAAEGRRGWINRGDPRMRAAACTGLGAVRSGPGRAKAWDSLGRGLRDPDASVRAACARAASIASGAPASAIARLHVLGADRDREVRAAAVAAIAVVDPAHVAKAVDDPAANVRAAYAAGIGRSGTGSASKDLIALADDRDPDVRAAAWTAIGTSAEPASALRAAADPSPNVRRAVAAVLGDDAAIARLITDEAPEVRSAALQRLAVRLGRAASADPLLSKVAVAPAASAERVRAALAWLLAR